MRIDHAPSFISGFQLVSPAEDLPWLSHCGDAHCARWHSVRWHTHPTTELLYIVGGRLVMSYDDDARRTTATDGDLLITPAHTPHRWAQRQLSDYHLLWVNVDLPALGWNRQLIRQLSARPYRLLSRCYELEWVLRGIMRQVVSRPPMFSAVLHQQLRTLSLLVQQRLGMAAMPSGGQSGGLFSVPVEKAIRFMRENLTRRLALTDLAHAAGDGLSTFRHAFRVETGIAPAAYHLKLRLAAAREALLSADASIREVSLLYGFSSQQHFTSAFTREFHTPPGRWQTEAHPN